MLANLQSSSVTSQNFTIVDGVTGARMAPTGAVYLPQRNEVVLSFGSWSTPASLCSVDISSNVLCVGGASAAGEDVQANVTLSNKTDIYGVSVEKLTFEQEGAQVVKPNLTKEFKVIVRVANTTKSARSNCEVLINLDSYLNGPININDEERVIAVGAESTATYEFTVTPAMIGGATVGTISAVVQ